MINTPKAILQAEYIYFDSSFTSSNFQTYTDQPGASNTALGRTMVQINDLNLQSIAWNDEKPNGSTSSSSAHSKTVIAQNPSSNLGFIIDHSLPSYPSFTKNLVNFAIGDSQRIYGQHVFCMSLTTTQIEEISINIRTIKPYVYQSNVPSVTNSPNLYALGSSVASLSSSNFNYYEFAIGAFNFKSIYKNGNNSKNCSIFEDGLNNYLGDSLFA